jgi:hypothetical protein
MEPSLREQERARRAAQGVPVFPVRTVTASETLRESDAFLVADTTAGSVTLTLPKAAFMLGRLLWIKKLVAANTLTVDGDGSETIDGAATLAWATQYTTNRLLSNGSAWHIV